MVTAQQRSSSELASSTSLRIAAVVPPGLAAWLPRLTALLAADADATRALITLETEPDTLADAEAACDRLVMEWQRAAERFEAAGRPVPA